MSGNDDLMVGMGRQKWTHGGRLEQLAEPERILAHLEVIFELFPCRFLGGELSVEDALQRPDGDADGFRHLSLRLSLGQFPQYESFHSHVGFYSIRGLLRCHACHASFQWMFIEHCNAFRQTAAQGLPYVCRDSA